MIHWSKKKAELARMITAPARLLIACDYDGTLAPIVTDPVRASLLPGMKDVLRQFVETSGLHLAIVSGRPVDDLKERIDLAEATYIGSHGLEMRGHGLDGLPSEARSYHGRFVELAEELRRSTRFLTGIFIEEKPLGVALHYRNATKLASNAALNLLQRFTQPSPQHGQNLSFRIQEGLMVAELLPATSYNKGRAVCLLLDRLGMPRSSVICVGDDVTDESMFRALPNGISLHVGHLNSQAAYQVEDPAEMLTFLRWVGELRISHGADAYRHTSLNA